WTRRGRGWRRRAATAHCRLAGAYARALCADALSAAEAGGKLTMRLLAVIAVAGIVTSFLCLAVASAIDPGVYRQSHIWTFGEHCFGPCVRPRTDGQDIAWHGGGTVMFDFPAAREI